MVNAFAASGIVAVVPASSAIPGGARPDLRRPCALAYRLCRRDRRRADRYRAARGLVGFTLAAGIAMGLLGERLSDRDVAIGMVLALARLRPPLPALLHGVRDASDDAPFRQRARGRPHDPHPCRAGPDGPGGLRDHAVRSSLPPCSRNSPRRTACRCALTGISSGDRGADRVGMRQIVGILLVFTLMVGPPAAAQRLTSGSWTVSCSRHCARRSLARHHHRLPHRLADELLHHRVERAGLFP